MTDPQQPEHPAGAYYPAPAHAANPPNDLTVQAVLAFGTASLATVFNLVSATVAGRAGDDASSTTPSTAGRTESLPRLARFRHAPSDQNITVENRAVSRKPTRS